MGPAAPEEASYFLPVAVINQVLVAVVLIAALGANSSVQIFFSQDSCYGISYSRKNIFLLRTHYMYSTWPALCRS